MWQEIEDNKWMKYKDCYNIILVVLFFPSQPNMNTYLQVQTFLIGI